MNLGNLLNKIAQRLGVDYIVEQGESGIWTYRKWASGIAECWGNYDKVAITSGYIAISLPSGLFLNNSKTQITAPWYGALSPRGFKNLLVTDAGQEAGRYVVYLRNLDGTIPTGDYSAHVFNIGLWKNFSKVGGVVHRLLFQWHFRERRCFA